MKYPVVRNPDYDFAGQGYAENYPNLHKYPATMLPQIGINLLKEFNLRGGCLLDIIGCYGPLGIRKFCQKDGANGRTGCLLL